ncbi:enoyl-CoA hydratase/isomerase family protein [Nocardioides insulae]|uniref:enoyl-CoA hydratase/isomerase family protein n=1 Tax=Nocardioides insulae TaxID=394734 RepID=UPI00041D5AC9|nr:enoyl-CoA hydratase-related protein [Nocardioides insulae]
MPMHYKDDGAVRVITLDNPAKKNAIDPATLEELFPLLRETGFDDSVRAVVLQGEGGDFCSGADVSGTRSEHPLRRIRHFNDVALALHDLPQPVVAKVDGVAVGAGLSLALACDFVVASERARFSAIFARRGLSLDAGASWLLPHTVGMLQAKRLALLAEMIDAAEAERIGLATYVVPVEEIDGYVADLAARLAAGPPIGLASTKALLNKASQGSFHDALEAEGTAQAVNFATDAPAAMAAFRNRTEPEFTGQFQVSPSGHDSSAKNS